jgi:hypothetical protein
MKIKTMQKFLPYICIVSLILLYTHKAILANSGSVTVVPGQGVDFQQVDFVYSEKVTQLDSDWGRVSINPEVLGSSTGISSGYLNIFTDAGTGWVVQNIPIDLVSDGKDIAATYFSLGLSTPTDVGTLSAHVEFSPSPQITFSDGLRSDFPVGVAQWNARGASHSDKKGFPAAPPPNLITFEPDGETTKDTQRHDVNVETAVNQCGPMAIANSLQYLEDQFVFNVPHDHKPGLKGDNTLVGQLDTETKRKVKSRTDGDGLNVKEFLKGKFSYLSKNGLKNNLVHKHQGRGSPHAPLPDGNFSDSGITSENKGKTVTFEFICDEIKNGEDVELFWNEESEGKVIRGHYVRVYECGKTKGKPFISFLHDRLQSNDTKGTETVKANIGDFNGNGILNVGSRSYEIRFVLSESLKEPTPRPTPTPTPTSTQTATPTPSLIPSPTPAQTPSLTPIPT